MLDGPGRPVCATFRRRLQVCPCIFPARISGGANAGRTSERLRRTPVFRGVYVGFTLALERVEVRFVGCREGAAKEGRWPKASASAAMAKSKRIA